MYRGTTKTGLDASEGLASWIELRILTTYAQHLELSGCGSSSSDHHNCGFRSRLSQAHKVASQVVIPLCWFYLVKRSNPAVFTKRFL